MDQQTAPKLDCRKDGSLAVRTAAVWVGTKAEELASDWVVMKVGPLADTWAETRAAERADGMAGHLERRQVESMAWPMVEYLAETMVDWTSDCWAVRLDALMAGVMAETMVAKRVVRTAGEKASRSAALMAGTKDP